MCGHIYKCGSAYINVSVTFERFLAQTAPHAVLRRLRAAAVQRSTLLCNYYPKEKYIPGFRFNLQRFLIWKSPRFAGDSWKQGRSHRLS